jgi:SAM-dependent methyltransferase
MKEMEQLLPLLPVNARILEFGAGTGQQARFLSDRGFDVTAIDLASSNYAAARVFPVQEYDGHHIPLKDNSIDIVFSSNVLEHVANHGEIFAEFRRVLKPGGFALHVLPTPAWRFWTFVTGAVASLGAAAVLPVHLAGAAGNQRRVALLGRGLRRIVSGFIPRGHGTSAEGFSELWTFSRFAWLRKFRRHGFELIEDLPMGLFYTGVMLRGPALSFPTRRALSRTLGSASHLYKLKVQSQSKGLSN